MKCSHESESGRRKKKVLNIVEFGELVYIRLDDGKKYLLNGDGCWRCGSTGRCFGNMDDNELEVVCEFGFFDEVRSLFLLLLRDRVNQSMRWVRGKTSGESCHPVVSLIEAVSKFVDCANVKCA